MPAIAAAASCQADGGSGLLSATLWCQQSIGEVHSHVMCWMCVREAGKAIFEWRCPAGSAANAENAGFTVACASHCINSQFASTGSSLRSPPTPRVCGRAALASVMAASSVCAHTTRLQHGTRPASRCGGFLREIIMCRAPPDPLSSRGAPHATSITCSQCMQGFQGAAATCKQRSQMASACPRWGPWAALRCHKCALRHCWLNGGVPCW